MKRDLTTSTLLLLSAVGVIGAAVSAIASHATRRTRRRSAAQRDGGLPALANAPRVSDPRVIESASRDAASPSIEPAGFAVFHPMPLLPDGRKPRITSHHKSRNPSRSTHDGVDWFYPVLPRDPAWKRGDGGGTSNGRWIVPPGTPAIAAASGRVQLAGDTPTGWRVWIDHGALRSGYFHLSKLFVEQGEKVSAGQQLGIVGHNPADHDAVHLHFEVSATDRYQPIDPVPFLEHAKYIPLGESSGPIRHIDGISALTQA